MKISVDGTDLYTLSETQKAVICNDIHADVFDQDMKRRLHWVLNHKYERCLERMKNEWMPKLKGRVASVPTDDDAFAQLVMSQPDYRSRKQREAEADAAKPK
jgi:hypothetical protein